MPLLRDGDMVGPYRISSLLGAGGMGEVYLAEKVGPFGFRRQVAVKCMFPSDDTAGRVDLFQREARLAAQLHHTNLVPVIDCGVREDGLLWLAEELVDGVDLCRLCLGRELPLGLSLFIAGELLRGLSYLHERQVVHHDVKPANVMVGRDGAVRLTDFGIADVPAEPHPERSTQRGSPAYMAPECAMDFAPATERSDLFGVGLILWEMLTGRPLCAMKKARAALLDGRLPRVADTGLELPPHVERFLLSLLMPDPGSRCPSAEDALRALAAMPESRWSGARELETFVLATAPADPPDAMAPTVRVPRAARPRHRKSPTTWTMAA